jgi:hypothetical protein
VSAILAIDPGSSVSGWLAYVPEHRGLGQITNMAIESNEELVNRLRTDTFAIGLTVVIEWTAPRGMPASAELFETLFWAGRFAEAARASGLPVDRLERAEVKRRLCGQTRAKDANVRQALIDRFGGVDGKAAAIGRKSAPGPLYGVSSHLWAALAVAVTYADGGT